MRADRLVATLLLLQQRGRVTAAEVAAEMEVSVPTARRDLEALSAAGVPVYAQPGRGGGWELVGGARTDLSGLTSEEARALFLLLGATIGPARSPAVESALRKLTQALPATFRESARAAASALLVDESPWGGAVAAEAPAHLETLRSAIIERRRVEISYVDRAGRASVRRIDPWGLVVKDGAWYVVAGTAQGRRTLRVDRVTAARATDEPADAAPAALAQAWAETVDAIEARRGAVEATVLVEPQRWQAVQRHFGRHVRLAEPGQSDTTYTSGHDRMVSAVVTAHTVTGLAEQLAGWGAALIVTGPPSVTAALARIGRDLVQRYDTSAHE